MFLVIVENKGLKSIKNVYFFRGGKKESLLENVRREENLPSYEYLFFIDLKNIETFSFKEAKLK